MYYTINIFGEAGVYEALPQARQEAVMAGHKALQAKLRARGDFVSAKLMPPSTAVRVEPAPTPDKDPLIVDGPFSETKESFLGFYIADFDDLDDALAHARLISSPVARLEVRPVDWAGGLISSD